MESPSDNAAGSAANPLSSLVHTPLEIHPDNVALYEKAKEEFREAERRLKIIEREQVGEGVDIPSINELRYVGFHVLEAMSADKETQAEQLRRALRHCQRASYDAMELGIINLLEKISIFRNDYRRVSVSGVVSDYVGKLRKVEQINRFIAGGSDETKVTHYQKCEAYYHQLWDIAQFLEYSREELNKKLFQFRLAAASTTLALMIALGAWQWPANANRAEAVQPVEGSAPTVSPVCDSTGLMVAQQSSKCVND